MIDSWLRRIKDVLFHPLAQLLNTFLTPLAVTLMAFATALVASYMLWHQMYLLALFLWIGSRILDGLDGTMARLSNRQTVLGGYIDLVCDVIVYALFPLAAASAGGEGFMAVALLLAAYYINLTCWAVLAAILERQTYPGGKSDERRTTIIMPRGIIEGFETVVIYGLFCLLPQFLWHIFILTAILTMISALMRVVWAVRNRAILEVDE